MRSGLYFGFHSSVFFTWGSVALIGYISIYFKNSLSKRLLGAASAAIIFFILSNFGVWISGGYGYTLKTGRLAGMPMAVIGKKYGRLFKSPGEAKMFFQAICSSPTPVKMMKKGIIIK